MNEKPYNPWREFIENVINGDNFFRTQEYYDLLDDIDARIAKEAEQDASIAELTEQLNLADRLLVAEMRAKSELTAEVERYRVLAQAMYETFREGFTTTRSHGPTGDYRMVTKFHSLREMQSAEIAWIDVCIEGRETIARNALREGNT